MLSVKEMQNCALRAFPGMKIAVSVRYKNGIMVSLIPKDGDPKIEMAEFHRVDGTNGKVSGTLPTLSVLGDPEFMRAFRESEEDGEDDDEDVLSHHGIKSQEWGVRNGPPYPLSQAKHNRVVGGADDTAGGWLAEHRKQKQEKKNAKMRAKVDKMRARSNANLSNEKQHEVDRRGITHDTKKLYDKGIAVKDKEFSASNPPSKIKGPHSADDDMKAVNPLYKEGGMDARNNCVLCSVTYDMRRRGYDTCAKLTKNPTHFPEIMKEVYGEYPDMGNSGDPTFADVEKKMLSQYKDKTRGIMVVSGAFGGHAIAFEVEDRQVIIRDAQSGKKMRTEDLAKYGFNPWFTTTFRTDDKKVNFEGLNFTTAELQHSFMAPSLYDDYLAHYGVKGQKWGVRRYQNEDGSYTSEGKTRRSMSKLAAGNASESSTWKAKDASTLSDEELRRRLNRLNQEKQYRELTKSRSSKAREWISKTAKTVLVTAAITAASEVMKNKYADAMKSWGEVPVDATKVSSKAMPKGAWHSK